MSRPPEPPVDRLMQQAGWTRRLARALLGDESAAEDVLQETWESARRHPPHAGAPVEPWFRAAIRNRMINRARDDRRRDGREQKAEGAAPAETPEELLARVQIHQRVVEAVTRLPEPYRQTLLLRYFEELSSAEIGARLDLPAATVRGRLKTALALLRDELDRGGGGRKVWLGAVALLAGRSRDLAVEPVVSVIRAAGRMAIKTAAVGACVVGALVIVERAKPVPASPPVLAERKVAPLRLVPAEPVADRPVVAPPPPAPAEVVPATVVPAAIVAPAPAGTQAAPGFSISGQVRAAIRPLSPYPVDMSADPYCRARPTINDEQLLVAADGSVANAVVRVFRGAAAVEPPAQPVELALRGCRYEPHVLVAYAGQRLLVKNEDGTTHGLRVLAGGGNVFTASLAAEGAPWEKTGPAAGDVLELRCDLHPWMHAYVVGVDNPYFAVTGPDGRYTLNGLAPGDYGLEVWHEGFHRNTAWTRIAANTTSKVNFTLYGAEYAGPNLGDNRCQLTTKGDSPVAKACSEGGIKRAKATMKWMQKVGKEKGLRYECDTCHKDESANNWTLNRGAEEKFKKLLAVQR